MLMIRTIATIAAAAMLAVVPVAASTTPAAAATNCVVVVANPSGVVVAATPQKPTLSVKVTSATCGAPKRWHVIVTLPGKELFKEVITTSRSGATETISIPVGPADLKAGKAKAGTRYEVRVSAVFADGHTASNRMARAVFLQDTRMSASASTPAKGEVALSGKLQRYDWTAMQWVGMSGAIVNVYVGGNSVTGIKTGSAGKFSHTYTRLAAGTTSVVPTYSGSAAYGRTSAYLSVDIR